MDTSSDSADSARLPDDPYSSPDSRQLVVEPLSTKRERMEARSRSSDKIFSRVVRSAPVVPRMKHRVAPYAQHILFKTPPNSPLSPLPIAMEKSDNAYCTTDHECVSVPIESPYYNRSIRSTYFEQVFVIEKKLGEGSFGEVFQVKCREDNKSYAVKRAIEPYRSTSDRALKLREVQKHEELTPHPNLVFFHNAWEERGRLYIQTELCTTSLAEYCKYDAPPKDEIWLFFFDIINAVDYLHSRGLIHLDIKPENIFLTADKICKLGDFGLMFDLKRDHMATVEEGDSKYLAPEVLNNQPTQAADIFSIGMSMLEVATNLDLPTTGENWHALRNRKVPQKFLMMLDPDLRDLILLMIDPIPGARPTARQIINDPVVYWPFTRRTKCSEMHQAMSQYTHHLSFLSRWASRLWSLMTAPVRVMGEMIENVVARRYTARKNHHGTTAIGTCTPDMKHHRVGGYGMVSSDAHRPHIDYDSSFSDEEDTRFRSMPGRSLMKEFYSLERPPALVPSLSPFREYDECRERLEAERKFRDEEETERRIEEDNQRRFEISHSPSAFVYRDGVSSAPMGGAMRRLPPMAVNARTVGITARPVNRLVLDSDSDDGKIKISDPKTPLSCSTRSRSHRRSAFRKQHDHLPSRRAPKLDFSILDHNEDRADDEESDFLHPFGSASKPVMAAGDG